MKRWKVPRWFSLALLVPALMFVVSGVAINANAVQETGIFALAPADNLGTASASPQTGQTEAAYAPSIVPDSFHQETTRIYRARLIFV